MTDKQTIEMLPAEFRELAVALQRIGFVAGVLGTVTTPKSFIVGAQQLIQQYYPNSTPADPATKAWLLDICDSNLEACDDCATNTNP